MSSFLEKKKMVVQLQKIINHSIIYQLVTLLCSLFNETLNCATNENPGCITAKERKRDNLRYPLLVSHKTKTRTITKPQFQKHGGWYLAFIHLVSPLSQSHLHSMYVVYPCFPPWAFLIFLEAFNLPHFISSVYQSETSVSVSL